MLEQIERALDQASEYLFGHVPTPQEKMAAARKQMEQVIEELDDRVLTHGIHIKMYTKKAQLAEMKYDEGALRAAEKGKLLAEKSQIKAKRRADGFRLRLEQSEDLEQNGRMLNAQMRVVALTNEAQTLPDQTQLQQMLYKLTSDADRASVANDMMADALDAVAETDDEEVLDEEDKEVIENRVQQRMTVRVQKRYDVLPKPRGTPQSSARVLAESDLDRLMNVKHEQRRLEEFLAK
jgi:hypothetical protein